MSKDYNREQNQRGQQNQQQNKLNQGSTSHSPNQKHNPQERINQSGGQRPGQGSPSQQKPLNRDPMRDKKEQK